MNFFKKIVFFIFIFGFFSFLSAEPSKHAPFAKGECKKCHTTAGAQDGALKEDMPNLCYDCHKDYEKNSYIHGPVAAGACTTCHNPHESENKKLLTSPSINELCYSCHYDKGESMKSMSTLHPPAVNSCTNCHDPHGENHLYQLKADRKKDICLTCHTEKKEWLENAKFKHGAVDRGEQCVGCHNPHSSNQQKLLQKENSKELCLTCHNAQLRANEDSKLLINMEKHLASNPDWHGPSLWGDCAACHNPHGSDNFRILKKPFPKGSVSEFDTKNYICFQCHNEGKIADKFTTTETNFRNGNTNVHYIHVNSKGITCRTCHDFHGTKEYPHHLKLKSSFGSAVEFPIRFIETPTGGSCNPICHAKKEYDRENPKINKAFK